MRVRLALASLTFTALLLGSTAALAQQPATPTPAPAPGKGDAKAATPAGTGTPAAGEMRRDPAGITGVSPFQEQLKKGEDAYVARDFPGAVAAFQEAIKLDTQKMLGYYRIGEAQLATGNMAEAEAQWQNALNRTGLEDLKAKVLFVLADLKERQQKWQEAKDAWTAYANAVQGKSWGYPGTAAERIKMIDRRVKDEKDYGEVKARIKKREEELAKEQAENAKKDTKNK